MIKVKSKYGYFEITDGNFVEGESVLEEVFALIKNEPLSPEDGPTDYALAMLVLNGTAFEVVESSFPSEKEGVVE